MEAPPNAIQYQESQLLDKPNPIKSNSFNFNKDNTDYSLDIECGSNIINFKLESSNSFYTYKNTLNITDIQNLLDLSSKSDYEKIIKIFQNAIEKNELEIIDINKGNNLVLRIYRVLDIEKTSSDLELIKCMLDENKVMKKLQEMQEMNTKLKEINKALTEKNLELIKTNNNLLEETEKLKNKNKILIEENIKLKKADNILVNNINNDNIVNIDKKEQNSDPKQLKEKQDIINTNTNCNKCGFEVFTSIKDNIEYLASGNKKTFNIDIVDLRSNILVKSLIGHKTDIFDLNYYLNNQREYLLSIDNNIIILWDLISKNNGILLKIKIDRIESILSTLLLFNINNNNYIIASSFGLQEYTKIFNANDGSFIKNISDTDKNKTCYMIYWDYNNNHYIIELCENKIEINDFIKNKKYATLSESPEDFHRDGFLYENYFLICSSSNGYIRIWDLIKKSLNKVISVKKHNICGILLWNKNYVICADCNYNSLDIVDIVKGKVEYAIKSTHDKKGKLKFIKKFTHMIYGECVLSSGKDNTIKLWTL